MVFFTPQWKLERKAGTRVAPFRSQRPAVRFGNLPRNPKPQPDPFRLRRNKSLEQTSLDRRVEAESVVAHFQETTPCSHGAQRDLDQTRFACLAPSGFDGIGDQIGRNLTESVRVAVYEEGLLRRDPADIHACMSDHRFQERQHVFDRAIHRHDFLCCWIPFPIAKNRWRYVSINRSCREATAQ